MYDYELKDSVEIVAAVIMLIIGAAFVGGAFYVLWLVIKALQKYLAA